jgi:hypothetical protein
MVPSVTPTNQKHHHVRSKHACYNLGLSHSNVLELVFLCCSLSHFIYKACTITLEKQRILYPSPILGSSDLSFHIISTKS